MDLTRWLQAKRCAVDAADEPLLLELARDLLLEVAVDPENPRAHECAAAAELAIASYHALAGDWTVGAALARVKGKDPETVMVARTTTARARLDSKAAWSAVISDVVVRTRALRHLGEHSKARRGKSNVVPFRRTG